LTNLPAPLVAMYWNQRFKRRHDDARVTEAPRPVRADERSQP